MNNKNGLPDLEPRCRVPENKHGQLYELLYALKSGKKLTVAKALTEHGCYALSQRMGDLRKMGWPIVSRWVEANGGARVKEYSLG